MRNILFAAMVAGALSVSAGAQAQEPPGYGAPISLEQAKKAAAAAAAEMKKNGWKMAIAIVEPNGALVYFEKNDDTQYGSVKVAMEKATSAALFRRPTKVFSDFLGKGSLYLLKLGDSNPVPGGLPIVVGGKVIGGMGASGGSGAQDTQVAEAGLAALK